MKAISPKTAVYAVIGDTVTHSLSPRIHNRWIAEEGLDAVYLAHSLKSANPVAAIEAAYDLGFAGLNITFPYKAAALAAATSADPIARRLGAANVLVRGPLGWQAHNTDHSGFLAALALAAPDMALAKQSALLIGAGGAARAALYALSESGARVVLANRSHLKAEALVADLGVEAQIVDLKDVQDVSKGCGLVVNATSAGHDGTGFALAHASAMGVAFDLSYGAASKPFLSMAGDRGWRPVDGLGMLVAQASQSVRLWRGLEHSYEPALRALLGELNP